MELQNERLSYLFNAWYEDRITQTEREELNQLMEEKGLNDGEISELMRTKWEQGSDGNYFTSEESQRILQAVLGKSKLAPVRQLYWRRIAVAASILLLLAIGSYLILFNNKPDKSIVRTTTDKPSDVQAPDKNKAMITLADGRIIYLDSIDDGALATQGNVVVTKGKSGEIVYESKGSPSSSSGQYNTLFNPRGSKVTSITLTDGTKVWLNAESSIKYFTSVGNEERRVEITGEAYFEVAAAPSSSPAGGGQRKLPFIVKKGDVEVTVLGTHFNVNAYDDEEVIRVTLLEGSVKVASATPRNDVILKPEQQATVADNNGIKVNVVSVDEVVAWKNDLFLLDNTSLPVVLRQVSRWYDVEVEYKGAIPTKKFGGGVARKLPLSKMVELLKANGVVCRVEGKKLIVQN